VHNGSGFAAADGGYLVMTRLLPCGVQDSVRIPRNQRFAGKTLIWHPARLNHAAPGGVSARDWLSEFGFGETWGRSCGLLVRVLLRRRKRRSPPPNASSSRYAVNRIPITRYAS
jgi:hypothetical protein